MMILLTRVIGEKILINSNRIINVQEDKCGRLVFIGRSTYFAVTETMKEIQALLPPAPSYIPSQHDKMQILIGLAAQLGVTVSFPHDEPLMP